MVIIIRTIWNDVKQGENIDLYLTVMVAIILAILNLFSLATTWSAPITLAVLGLLAIATLVNRRKMEILTEKLGLSTEKILLDKFPDSRDSDLRSAKELWIVGGVLNKTVHTYYSIFQEKLERGDKIKILVITPGSKAVDFFANRKFNPTRTKEINNYISLTLSSLCNLQRAFPKRLEIRVIDQPIHFGILATDIRSSRSSIYIEYYPFRMERDAPIMEFHPQDGKWYDFYLQQLEILWNNAAEWNCSQ